MVFLVGTHSMHILMASDAASDPLRDLSTSTGLVQKRQAFTPAAQTVYFFCFKSNVGITLRSLSNV